MKLKYKQISIFQLNKLSKRLALALLLCSAVVSVRDFTVAEQAFAGEKKVKLESRSVDSQNAQKVETLIQEFEPKFNVPTVDAKSARHWQVSETSKVNELSKKTVFLDVREDNERAVSTIEGALSLEEFSKIESELKDSSTRVVVYCTIGYRSAKVALKLKDKGIDAWNLRGSVLLWAHAGHPLVNGAGLETKRLHVYGERWDLAPHEYETVKNLSLFQKIKNSL